MNGLPRCPDPSSSNCVCKCSLLTATASNTPHVSHQVCTQHLSFSITIDYTRAHTHTNTHIMTGLGIKIICYLLPFSLILYLFGETEEITGTEALMITYWRQEQLLKKKRKERKRRRDMRKTWRQTEVTSQMNSSIQETVCLIFSFHRRRYLTRCFNTNRKDDDSM